MTEALIIWRRFAPLSNTQRPKPCLPNVSFCYSMNPVSIILLFLIFDLGNFDKIFSHCFLYYLLTRLSSPLGIKKLEGVKKKKKKKSKNSKNQKGVITLESTNKTEGKSAGNEFNIQHENIELSKNTQISELSRQIAKKLISFCIDSQGNQEPNHIAQKEELESNQS